MNLHSKDVDLSLVKDVFINIIHLVTYWCRAAGGGAMLALPLDGTHFLVVSIRDWTNGPSSYEGNTDEIYSNIAAKAYFVVLKIMQSMTYSARYPLL